MVRSGNGFVNKGLNCLGGMYFKRCKPVAPTMEEGEVRFHVEIGERLTLDKVDPQGRIHNSLSTANQPGCAMRGGICDVHACIVSRTSAILFKPTVNQQRTLHFKSQPCVEDLVSSVVDGIRTHNLLIDNLCLTTGAPPTLQI